MGMVSGAAAYADLHQREISIYKSAHAAGPKTIFIHNRRHFKISYFQANKLSNDVVDSLCAIVGESNVSSAESVREHHGRDESHHRYVTPHEFHYFNHSISC